MHWLFQCPPCRVFTPQLLVTYDKLKAEEKNFAILFISSDRSESSFTEYYGSMPGWFALPYKDERCIQLTRLFGIQGEMLPISSTNILSSLFVCMYQKLNFRWKLIGSELGLSHATKLKI